MVECVKGEREQIMGKTKIVSCNTGGPERLIKGKTWDCWGNQRVKWGLTQRTYEKIYAGLLYQDLT